MENSFLEFALKYLDRGFSVIPIKANKKPYIKWEEFQKRRPTPEEVREWWGKWPSAMIGIVTGQISRTVVIDIDENRGHEEMEKYIPDTLLMPTARTPRGGQHLYLQSPEKSISGNVRAIPGCDLRAEGNYIIAPPSKNGTGAAYERVRKKIQRIVTV